MLCEHNSWVAKSCGRIDLSALWDVVMVMLDKFEEEENNVQNTSQTLQTVSRKNSAVAAEKVWTFSSHFPFLWSFQNEPKMKRSIARTLFSDEEVPDGERSTMVVSDNLTEQPKNLTPRLVVPAAKVTSGSIFSDSEEDGKEVNETADSDSDDPFRANSPVSQVGFFFCDKKKTRFV